MSVGRKVCEVLLRITRTFFGVWWEIPRQIKA
jgi:hypothetical protein